MIVARKCFVLTLQTLLRFAIFSVYTAQMINSEWTYIVLADWHGAENGAETFAIEPSDGSSPSELFDEQKRVLQHIYDNYGGELVVLPGDSNSGKWHEESFREKFDKPLMTPEEVIAMAGRNCYSTVRNLFEAVGYNKIFVAIGDHEIGGNPWSTREELKLNNLQIWRDSFIQELNSYKNGSFRYKKDIGTAKSRPLDTPFAGTSFAVAHRNALFVTVDAFEFHNEPYFDRENSAGGEGYVSCTVTGDHLAWFEEVLKEADKDPSIDHIFVQAHIPILQPVRKIYCSGQYLDRATSNKFWKLMRDYGVDVYFAGEVHATTASKDPESNLIQIVSRGNHLNNFLQVKVNDYGFTVKAYNEVGQAWRWNANYTQYGELSVRKTQGNTSIESFGILELLDTHKPLIRFKFEKSDIFPLNTRQVIGMKYSNREESPMIGNEINIRGKQSTEGMINHGSFGQQYDTQVANLGHGKGIRGRHSGSFTKETRVAIASTGPIGAGEMVAISLFFKTKSAKEVLLFAYASPFGGGKFRKDVFLLTLKEGQPVIYLSPDRYLVPKTDLVLNNNLWHSIAVSMPSKSCLLSELDVYANGAKIETTIVGTDKHIFYGTNGNVSLDGWGYSNRHYDDSFPNVSYFAGRMDDFRLWARSIEMKDLQKATKKNFVSSSNTKCKRRDKDIFSKKEGVRTYKACSDLCDDTPTCWGYEVRKSNKENNVCYHYENRPKSGKESDGAECSAAVK